MATRQIPYLFRRRQSSVNAMSRHVKISCEEADKRALASISPNRIAQVEEVANLVVMPESALIDIVDGIVIEIDVRTR